MSVDRLSQLAAYPVEAKRRGKKFNCLGRPYSDTHLRAMCAFVLDKLSQIPAEHTEERQKLNPNRQYVWELAKQECFTEKYLGRPARVWRTLATIFSSKVTPRLRDFVDDETDLAAIQEISGLPSKKREPKPREIVEPRLVVDKRPVKPVQRFEIPVRSKLKFRHAYSLIDGTDRDTKFWNQIDNEPDRPKKRKSRDTAADFDSISSHSDNDDQSEFDQSTKKSRDSTDDQSEFDRIIELKRRLNALTKERDALKAKNVKLRLEVDTPFRIAQIPQIPLVDYIDLILPIRHAPSSSSTTSSSNRNAAAAALGGGGAKPTGSRDGVLYQWHHEKNFQRQPLVSCYVETGEPIESLGGGHVISDDNDDDQSENDDDEFLSREETLALVKERIDFFENQLKFINSESATCQPREPVTIDLESLDASSNSNNNNNIDDVIKSSNNDILKFRASPNDDDVTFRATYNNRALSENDYETVSSNDDHSRQEFYDGSMDGQLRSV